jgi:hypothetical protein
MSFSGNTCHNEKKDVKENHEKLHLKNEIRCLKLLCSKIISKSVGTVLFTSFTKWKEPPPALTKSKLIIARTSGHNIPGDEPEVVADAILEMLSTARK